MLNKKLMVIALLGMIPAGAMAANNNIGSCGWGSKLMDGQSGIAPQVLGATTNGTSGNQTFGISSGTSECKQPEKFAQNERLNEFVYANLDTLAKDIAQGGGESVQTLAELMQVPPEKREAFYRNLQTHFAEIFPRENVEYAQVVDTIITLSS